MKPELGGLYKFAVKTADPINYYKSANYAILGSPMAGGIGWASNNKIFTVLSVIDDPFSDDKILEVLFEEKKIFLRYKFNQHKTERTNQFKRVHINAT